MPKTFSLFVEILDEDGDPLMVVPITREEEFFSHDQLVARVGKLRGRVVLSLSVKKTADSLPVSTTSGLGRNPACNLDIRHTDG